MKKPNKTALRNSLPKRRSTCPISYSLDYIGDKWTLLLVRDLVFKNKQHYGQFLKSEEAIASNILADRLLKLEAAGIVRKSPDPDNGARVVYTLMDKGLDLIPLMLELIAWGAAHDAETGAPKAFIRRLKEDRGGLIKELRQAQTLS